MRFYRNQAIEDQAAKRLQQLQQHLGSLLTPPIPIDTIAEQLLGLDFLWDQIEELPGETILGAICPERRQIILNDRHQALFRDKPGLERFTKGHEMGHWDLFLSHQGPDQPRLFDEGADPRLAYRGSTVGQVVVLQRLLLDAAGRELFRALQARADDQNEARAVNRYAAALAMPRDLICEEALKIDRTRWPNLYRLAERFDVTITALRVRLEQLKLLAIGSDGRTLYGSPEEASGQGSLF